MDDGQRNALPMDDGQCNALPMDDGQRNALPMDDGQCNALPMDDPVSPPALGPRPLRAGKRGDTVRTEARRLPWERRMGRGEALPLPAL